MSKTLVIVESPTKAKTLRKYLGPDYLVESSVGHIRDLPGKAAEVPAKYKKLEWASLAVNVEDDFEPLYVIKPDAKARIKELKDLAEASEAVEDNNYGVEVAALLVGGPMTVEEATTALVEAEGGSQTTEAAAAAHSLAGRLGMLRNSRETVFAAVEAARRCAMQQ